MTQIDHIVWGTKEPEADGAWMETLCGHHPLAGGSHPGRGTRNHLIGLSGEQQYLELIYPDAEQSHDGNLATPLNALHQSGVYHWVVRRPNLGDLHEKAVRRGLTSSGLLASSRRTPDGGLLEWTLLFLGGHGFGALVPFFIDWGASPHPASSLPVLGSMTRFELHTTDPERLGTLLQALDIDVPVKGSASNRILVEVETSAGRQVLPAADPFTDGLVANA